MRGKLDQGFFLFEFLTGSSRAKITRGIDTDLRFFLSFDFFGFIYNLYHLFIIKILYFHKLPISF